MIKTYIANTDISINVILSNNKNLHISFNALSNGGSTFTTDDEAIQKALEAHYRFNDLFRLSQTEEDLTDETGGKDTTDNKDMTDGGNTDDTTDGDNIDDDKQLKTVQVTDIASAKDYLADTFGISRTSLRSRKSIEEQATAHGIVFDGLDK